jgi:hypothetical protein
MAGNLIGAKWEVTARRTAKIPVPIRILLKKKFSLNPFDAANCREQVVNLGMHRYTKMWAHIHHSSIKLKLDSVGIIKVHGSAEIR